VNNAFIEVPAINCGFLSSLSKSKKKHIGHIRRIETAPAATEEFFSLLCKCPGTARTGNRRTSSK
jgi:hypothetical protein